MKVKRSKLAVFMNVAPGGAGTYAIMGDGITEQTIGYNPQAEEEIYVHQDSGVTDTTSYKPTIPTPQTAYVGDPVFDFVDGLRQERAVLGDCRTDIVIVYLYETATAGAYPAERQNVGIQIDDFGGAGGETLKINYTLNFQGDPEKGTFDPTTKMFTKS